jgi:hypothetical protein
MAIREPTEGLFASMGKGAVTKNEGRERLIITRKTSERLFDFSFRYTQHSPHSDTASGASRVGPSPLDPDQFSVDLKVHLPNLNLKFTPPEQSCPGNECKRCSHPRCPAAIR